MSLFAGTAKLTIHGKQLVTLSMNRKGNAFLGAALLLKKRGAYEYVTLHLLCQGLEILGKGYLLSIDYDLYKPELRKYGHNLIKLLNAIETATKATFFKPSERNELEKLSNLYRQHLLRYGSTFDILVSPETIPSELVLHRVKMFIRMEMRKNKKTAISFQLN